MGKVIPLPRPRSFTTPERFIEAIRESIFRDGRPYHVIASATGVSPSTIRNLAIGNTRWPRATTLFPLLHALGLTLDLRSKSS